MVEGIDLQNDALEEVEPVSDEDFEAIDKCIPVKSGWARFPQFGGFELVGQNPKPTNDLCGKYSAISGCLGGEDGERHNFVDLFGHDFHGKVVFQRIRKSCDSARCPECYRRGWVRREALKVEARLFESSKRWGLVEHIVVSLPVKDYGFKSFQGVRNKVVKVLESRGVVGGALVFHPARYDDARGWYFSPHWHVLGHIAGGYGCRGCKKYCLAHPECDGFEGRVRRLREKDGYVVKVLGKRGKRWSRYVLNGEKVTVVGTEDNVFGTISYELGHAGLVVGAKRANVVCWFGVCSYRRLKVTVQERKRLCPICAEPFVPLQVSGSLDGLPLGDDVFVVDRLDSFGEARFCERVDSHG